MALPFDKYPLPIAKFDDWGEHVTIPWEHALLHQGQLKGFTDVDANVTTTKKWLFLTPDSKWIIHAAITLESSTAFRASLFEKATVTILGDSVRPFNYNRNFPNGDTAYILAYKNPTISDSGKMLSIKTGGGTGIFGTTSITGSAQSSIEWNLKPKTFYLVSVTVAASGLMGINSMFYEETEF